MNDAAEVTAVPRGSRTPTVTPSTIVEGRQESPRFFSSLFPSLYPQQPTMPVLSSPSAERPGEES